MTLLLVGLAASGLTCGAAPLVRRWLIRHEVIDLPNHRSSHRVAVPRGGGLACLFGIITGHLIAFALGEEVPWAVLIAACVMASVGLMDDRFQLPAAPRLASQVAVGALLGASLGGTFLSFIGALAFPLIVNVVNFMDGINGITALTLTLWGITTTIVGLSAGAPAIATLGVVTSAAAVSFLPWNAPRARLFLGDVGSYLFGAITAGGILLASSEGLPSGILVAPLSIYIADVLTTMMRRALRGTPLTEAHREHVYQRLVETYNTPHIVVAVWVATFTLAITLLIATGSSWWQWLGVASLVLTYLWSVPLWGATLRRFKNTSTTPKRAAP